MPNDAAGVAVGAVPRPKPVATGAAVVPEEEGAPNEKLLVCAGEGASATLAGVAPDTPKEKGDAEAAVPVTDSEAIEPKPPNEGAPVVTADSWPNVFVEDGAELLPKLKLVDGAAAPVVVDVALGAPKEKVVG